MYTKEIVIGGDILLDTLIDGDSSLSLSEDGIEGTVIAYEPHGRETYAGPYDVEPDWVEQTLETQNKVMANNVTVESIYVARVDNPAGGRTVYIGGVINDG